MMVKKVSGKELLDSDGKTNRIVDLVRNSSQEASRNNSPNAPRKNAEVKRPRLGVSRSPPVQNLANNQPSSSEAGDEMWTSFATKINSSGGDGDATSIWDEQFPLGDLIDKHLVQEKIAEKVEGLELERLLQDSLTDSVRSNFRLRVLAQKFGYMEKKNKTYFAMICELEKTLSENKKNYVREINELKQKLAEYEKKMAEMTSLKDERNKLKKSLEKSSLENSRLAERGKEFFNEKIQCEKRLLIKEEDHKVTIGKLKEEIEELKVENSVQYKAGHDTAVRQMVHFAAGLNPWG